MDKTFSYYTAIRREAFPQDILDHLKTFGLQVPQQLTPLRAWIGDRDARLTLADVASRINWSPDRVMGALILASESSPNSPLNRDPFGKGRKREWPADGKLWLTDLGRRIVEVLEREGISPHGYRNTTLIAEE